MKLNNFLTDKRTFAPDGVTPNPEPAPTPAPQAPEPAATPAPGPDLSFIPADYVVDGELDTTKFSEHYNDLVARDAQYAERMKEVPEDGKYDFGLPDDFNFGDLVLPEGFSVQISDDPDIAPLLDDLGGMLKELGIPKSAGAKFAGLIAKYEATKFSKAFAAAQAEMASLGTPAQQAARMDAVERAMAARLPGDLAKALKSATTTANGIKALEALLAPRSPQVPPSRPAGVDTENMTAYDRLKYANAQQAKA